MTTCIIVEDNDLARLTIQKLITQSGNLTVIGQYSNAIEAYPEISRLSPDIVFLDIEMPGMSGIELLRSMKQRPVVILTTSRVNYAVEAFELNVADYLVKPVTMPRLLQSLEKAREILSRKNAELNKVENEHLFIKDNGVLKKILLDDILWIEAMGDYVKVFTKEKWHILHTTLKSVEEKLGTSRLMRIHRSYIVALDKIDSIEDGVLNINNTPVPIAESYRSQLIQKLKLL